MLLWGMWDTEGQSAFDFALQVGAAPGVRAVRQPDGGVTLKPGKLEIQGSVRQAARIMGVSRKTVLRMIEDGSVRAWKPRQSGAANCKFVVDLTSVYAHKETVTADGRGRL